MTILNLLIVAFGGAVGSACRYLTGHVMTRVFGFAFPWGTLTVNVVGSFAIGFLSELVARRFNSSLELRLLVITGFLGGFTTFSSFSLDTMALVERGANTAAISYVVFSVVVSLLAAFGGLAARPRGALSPISRILLSLPVRNHLKAGPRAKAHFRMKEI